MRLYFENEKNLDADEVIVLLEEHLSDIASEFPVNDRNKFMDGYVHGIIGALTLIKANVED